MEAVRPHFHLIGFKILAVTPGHRVRFSSMGEARAEEKGLALLKGLLRHYPFVLKNFKHYFQNLYRREIRRTNVVAPYAAVLYVTHKCNHEKRC